MAVSISCPTRRVGGCIHQHYPCAGYPRQTKAAKEYQVFDRTSLLVTQYNERAAAPGAGIPVFIPPVMQTTTRRPSNQGPRSWTLPYSRHCRPTHRPTRDATNAPLPLSSAPVVATRSLPSRKPIPPHRRRGSLIANLMGSGQGKGVTTQQLTYGARRRAVGEGCGDSSRDSIRRPWCLVGRMRRGTSRHQVGGRIRMDKAMAGRPW
ncbi:hypothetical protein FB45DRAFT_951929 [Roridomyces roridus]|uniref:Uncharacterized protein n=1 Tax=Roridomyces roridus TaxID=1738132 RepID=A0AAD7AZS0_9AGAR|nr:hypothetical protein FB45DRAFT_951929 [Roridomyces roridus]